jgi:hypothetical protein
MKMEFVEFIGKFLRDNLIYVAVAIVATTISIYGVYLKKAIKSMTKKMNFLFRFIVYVFVYAFGLGFLSTQAVILIAKALGGLNNAYLVLAVSLVFLLLCFLAKNENQI